MKIKLILEKSVVEHVKKHADLLDLKIVEEMSIGNQMGLVVGIQKPSDLYYLGFLAGSEITVEDVIIDNKKIKELKPDKKSEVKELKPDKKSEVKELKPDKKSEVKELKPVKNDKTVEKP